MKKNLPSNRDFGILLTLVLCLLSAYALYQGALSSKSKIYLIGTMIAGLMTLFVPNWFAPFNRLWMGVGELMGKVVSPLVLGSIFFLLITPIAFVSRLFGRDELRLNKIEVNSYWIDRPTQSHDPESFKNQF